MSSRTMNILIGYDGSKGAAAAIRDLALAGLPMTGVHATVMSVADVSPEPIVMSPYPFPGEVSFSADTAILSQSILHEAVKHTNRLAEEGEQLVRKLFPQWQVTRDVEVTSPYHALVQKGQRWPADLVVVGSNGKSALGRLFLGSVSLNVLSHTPCSVRIGRFAELADGESLEDLTPPSARPVRILVGFDGSKLSLKAVNAVRSRKWPAGSDVTLVTAVDSQLSTRVPGFGALLADSSHACAKLFRRFADKLARDLDEAGVVAVEVLVAGDPKKVLVELAHERHADCIFLGAFGHSRMERIVLGSVSTSVAMRAPCSVEIVREETAPPNKTAAADHV